MSSKKKSSVDPKQVVAFLAHPRYAVVGASQDRTKYGNKCLRCYLQHDRAVTPVNPKAMAIEGVACVASLSQLPEPRSEVAVSVVTPPHVTMRVMDDAAQAGIKYLWLQPGSESSAVLDRAKQLGLTVISRQCVLTVLGFDPLYFPPSQNSKL
ncbi:CoA-binding domain-containing protein [Tribonema minus]|uniref:CoA-binding domain-containing protein n=1 Tax=Tribonema minus TaxID=303371 RepID=A0A836CBV2_9STRA|nr:CoA-binding domain-containing protein [Tribonema minus]